jgi:hypothetical protein
MATQHGESRAAVTANLPLQSASQDMSTVRALFQHSQLSFMGLSPVQDLQPLEQYLILLRASVSKGTNEEVLQCILLARTARAVQRALEEVAPGKRLSGVDALYAWMSSTHAVDEEWIKRMKRRQSDCGRLWATDADCQWWEQHMHTLKIGSFNRLKVLAAKFLTMTDKLGGEEQRRDFWLQELEDQRTAEETRQVLQTQFGRAGEETMDVLVKIACCTSLCAF